MTCNLIGSAIVWKDEDTTGEWDYWWDNDNIHNYVTNWYETNKGNLK